jgi:hypothetical protein
MLVKWYVGGGEEVSTRAALRGFFILGADCRFPPAQVVISNLRSGVRAQQAAPLQRPMCGRIADPPVRELDPTPEPDFC